mmetsp:Transcript_10512/g.28773  ORF Transcript_10512/g.28773 Transcript_10512/m.28773 type:complete len:144 (-) Transcript_10512:681-1112(-)|eukprot:CAMPEP_0202376526 /NCGR_PEP_ID=MMETSP1127-20130417/7006_1 /ASSEMBLY_ACC=CAM_ASM_000462 /TAXON_ID=3047 /ORGANISM="Dunaliella tertiolecta, Strain CCMP1320" /LENGTH=143 /DNA_ID=CAMNT_0048974329 /DNA_START=1304 /DNA_END=1735 /DNA_ORIENTATION=-
MELDDWFGKVAASQEPGRNPHKRKEQDDSALALENEALKRDNKRLRMERRELQELVIDAHKESQEFKMALHEAEQRASDSAVVLRDVLEQTQAERAPAHAQAPGAQQQEAAPAARLGRPHRLKGDEGERRRRQNAPPMPLLWP